MEIDIICNMYHVCIQGQSHVIGFSAGRAQSVCIQSSPPHYKRADLHDVRFKTLNLDYVAEFHAGALGMITWK